MANREVVTTERAKNLRAFLRLAVAARGKIIPSTYLALREDASRQAETSWRVHALTYMCSRGWLLRAPGHGPGGAALYQVLDDPATIAEMDKVSHTTQRGWMAMLRLEQEIRRWMTSRQQGKPANTAVPLLDPESPPNVQEPEAPAVESVQSIAPQVPQEEEEKIPDGNEMQMLIAKRLVQVCELLIWQREQIESLNTKVGTLTASLDSFKEIWK